MRKAILSALICLSLALTGAAGLAAQRFTPVAGAEDANYWDATVWENQLILYDNGNDSHRAISADGRALGSVASLRMLSESEGEALYRSALALVHDAAAPCAVEFTVERTDDGTRFREAGLYRLDLSGGEAERMLELDLRDAIYDTVTGEACANCLSALMADGQLLLLFEDPEAQSAQRLDLLNTRQFLLQFDLSGGERRRYELENCFALLAYRDGALLLARSAGEQGEQLEIVRLRPDTGKEKVLERIAPEARVSALTIGPDLDVLYYAAGNRLWAVRPGGAPQTVGRLPFFNAQGLELLEGGTLAAYSRDQAVLVPIDWNYTGAEESLSVLGGEEYVESFAALHPETDVRSFDEGAASLTDLLLTRSAQPDVLILNSRERPYRQLRDRGYLLPLESAALEDFAARLHPDVAAALRCEGGICAIPLSTVVQPVFGVDRELWAALNLGPLPQSWADLLDFLERWQTLSADHPDVRLMMTVDAPEHLHSMLLSQLINEYDCWRADQPEAVGYDTELFRGLTSRLEGLDYAALCAHSAGGDTTSLINPYELPHVGWSSTYAPLCIPLSPELPAFMRTTVVFAAINPYSENIDAATTFLEHCAAQIAPAERIMLMPGENAPLRPDRYAEDLQALEAEIRAVEQRIAENTEPVELLPLQEELGLLRQSLENAENAWEVSAADIAAYRALSARISVFYKQELSDEERMQLIQIRENFLAGNLSVDDFVRRMDQRILAQALEEG